MYRKNARVKSVSASVLGVAVTLSSAFSTSGVVWAQGAGGANPGTLNSFTRVDKLAVAMPHAMKGEGSGTLVLKDEQGKRVGQCALKHTNVAVHISGYMVSVDVTQTFQNPYNKKIEAEYKFPLSDTAAVDDMTMRVGDRLIRGTIKRREEARRIYEEARDNGYVASLLDQERPNIFTQSVANIEPGKEIEVKIHYVDLLPFLDGVYSFVFPTVVGPRFMSGSHIETSVTTPISSPVSLYSHRTHRVKTTTAHGGTVKGAAFAAPAGMESSGSSAGTTMSIAPGESSGALNPLFAPEKTRSGHDISISVDMNAGMPVQSICCPLHPININPLNSSEAHIDLVKQDTIPNKDFVLSWAVGEDKLKTGYLAHREGKSGFITMMMVPPKHVSSTQAAPKEMIFVVDRSGSQDGAPLDKCKETMLYILDHMNPNDTFQVMSFANDTETLFSKPEHPNLTALARAKKYIQQLHADGGTWMGPAIEKACSIPEDKNRLRIVTFMSDGYVDNDMEILGLIHKYRGNSRWFSFGTGNSVNRFLIDGIAKEGGGEADYVLLNRPGREVAEHFYKEIATPVLTDVHVDFNGVKVLDVLPHQISDVWSERPLYIKARYTEGGTGTAVLRGFAEGKPYEQRIPIVLPAVEKKNGEIAQIWARSAVDELMGMDWFGAQSGEFNKKLQEQVTQIALNFHIMSQFTSFVAVDSAAKTSKGMPTLIQVPVDMPEGVSLEGLFKDGDHVFENMQRRQNVAEITSLPAPPVPQAQTTQPIQQIVPTGVSEFFQSASVPVHPWATLVNWLVASSRDANLFGDSPEFSMPWQVQNQQQVSRTFVPAPAGGSGQPSGGSGQWAGGNTSAGYGVASSASGSAGGMATGDEFASTGAQQNTGVPASSLPPPPMPAAKPSPAPVQMKSAALPQVPTEVAALPQVPTEVAALPPPPPSVMLSTQAGVANPYGSYSSGSGGGVPGLQGATNGTIGPQGADATYVTGLNTAGTIRVNNLANLEAFLNIICWILDSATVAIGILAIISGLKRLFAKKEYAVQRIIFGVVFMVAAPLCCVFLVPWLLWRGFAKVSRAKRPKDASAINATAIAPPTVTPSSEPSETPETSSASEASRVAETASKD